MTPCLLEKEGKLGTSQSKFTFMKLSSLLIYSEKSENFLNESKLYFINQGTDPILKQ